MNWSGAAELALMIPMIGLIWAAGVAWIKMSDYFELRRLAEQRARYMASRHAPAAARR
jgi:hypothetical protein